MNCPKCSAPSRGPHRHGGEWFTCGARAFAGGGFQQTGKCKLNVVAAERDRLRTLLAETLSYRASMSLDLVQRIEEAVKP